MKVTRNDNKPVQLRDIHCGEMFIIADYIQGNEDMLTSNFGLFNVPLMRLKAIIESGDVFTVVDPHEGVAYALSLDIWVLPKDSELIVR